MTPAQLARIKAFLGKIRLMSEDFEHVFYGRLLSQAPQLRIHFLNSVYDDTDRITSGFEEIIDATADPVALEATVRARPALCSAEARDFQTLSFDVFLWTAERCFGAEFTDEDRAAFTQLRDDYVGAIEGVGASLRAEARSPPSDARSMPAA